jgi:hypothetical protein
VKEEEEEWVADPPPWPKGVAEPSPVKKKKNVKEEE